MAKVLLSLIVYLILIPAISIFTMIHGWGINPASWGVIIGGYFLSFFLILLMSAANE